MKGKVGDPVIQIQTPYGGGKTHALIAMYHNEKIVTAQAYERKPEFEVIAGAEHPQLPQIRTTFFSCLSSYKKSSYLFILIDLTIISCKRTLSILISLVLIGW